jgi:hypothetical protein
MANNTYFSGAENLRDLMNGQGVYIDLSDPNAAELSLQRQDSQQMLSPAIHQRHDSFFSCSSLNTPRHSVSQHQAEAQPYANLHQNLHSPNIYPQHPVNNGMSRSASQYSSTSSGQQPHHHSLQRSSRGSFGSTLVTNGSEMSRSISSASAGQRTTLQPYPLQSHFQTGHFHTRRSSELSPHMNYDQFSTTAISPFDYTVSATPGEGVLGDEDEDRAFGQIGYDNE